MKKLSVYGIIVFLLAVQFAQGQTMDEIIDKHVAAMGGRQKIITLTTVKMTGTFIAAGSAPINTVTVKKHMVGSRIDIDFEGKNNYQVITQKNGWIFTPAQGDKEPRPLIDDQFKSSQLLLDLQGPFINYSQKGNKVQLLPGKDTVNGVLCYKLQVTAPNTNVTVYSIDSKSFLIVKSSTKMFQFGALEDVVTTYSDYKQNADGFWFAYSNINPRGETRYDKIESNVPVDLNIFKVK